MFIQNHLSGLSISHPVDCERVTYDNGANKVAKVIKAVCKQASEASLGGRLWSENGRQRGADLFRCFRFVIQAKKS